MINLKHLNEEQIKKLSMSECLEIERVYYNNPVMDLVYARMREIKMLESFELGAGTLTVEKLMNLLKDLDPDDIVEIYDSFNETSVWPNDVYVPDVRDANGLKRLIIEINTD